MQRYTSASTSINKDKLPAVYKKIDFKKYGTILDYGCGKYTNKIKEYVNANGCEWYGYDPYNFKGKKEKADLVICSNVLNVIDDINTVKNVIDDIFSLGNDVVFKIYEGNGTGIGKQTGIDQWQRNSKTVYYEKLMSDMGYNVTRKGNYIYGKVG